MPTMVKRSKSRHHKTLLCPHCNELFSRQGFNGHARMAHGLTNAEAKEAAAAAAQVPEQLPGEKADLPALPIGLAVAGGVMVLGVLLALRDRNVVGCTYCGSKLDVSKAREAGADLVQCPKCGALVQLP